MLIQLAKEREYAWAAGIWDGEGCCSTTIQKLKNKSVIRIRLSLSQCYDKEILTKFQRIVKVGAIYNSPRFEGIEYKWQSGKYSDILHVFGLLWPYLSTPKRDQIIKCLNRCDPPTFSRNTKNSLQR